MPLFRFRCLIGLSNWIIKSDKSGRQAKTILTVAGGKLTRRFAACEFPRGLREGIWWLGRLLTCSRIPPATQARKKGTSIASGPVQSQQNSGHEREFFTFRPCEKSGESKKVEGRGWTMRKKGRLTCKPLDFEKPILP